MGISRLRLLLFMSFLIAGLPKVCLAQSEVTLTPSKDNTLYEDDNGTVSNGKGSSLFVGRNSQGTLRRAVLAFDVAGAIPAGATIDLVELTLSMTQTQAGAVPITLHRVTSDWGEGASVAGGSGGQGTAAATGDATWLHTFFNTNRWNSNGGDFLPGASAITQVGAPASYTWGSTAQMVADVQDWLNRPNTNFGWILLGDEDTNQTAKKFSSREGNTPPSLRIVFSVPTANENDVEVPADVRLVQNFPNPFHQTTTISYVLTRPARVRLDVYDVLGRLVTTLMDETQGVGTQQAPFDAVTLPPGIYLYRLTTENTVRMRTMTVLR